MLIRFVLIAALAMVAGAANAACGVQDDGSFIECRAPAEIAACHECTAADGICLCTKADVERARARFKAKGSGLWIDQIAKDRMGIK
jgi:hypothetical protein